MFLEQVALAATGPSFPEVAVLLRLDVTGVSKHKRPNLTSSHDSKRTRKQFGFARLHFESQAQ